MGICDFFNQYFLHFAIIYVSVVLIYIFFSYKSSNPNLPPGKKGLPFIGETLSYVLDSRKGLPEKFITDRTTKYSPDVFRTSLLGEDMAVFCRAAGNKFLFSGQNKYVTSWWPHFIKKALMDPSTVHNSSKEESTKLRSYLPQFLKPESLQHYIPTFWTVHTTHKNPKFFPEPEKFDPSRFEGSGPAPYTFVPFGGGPRMCPGKEYARLEILVFIHNVVAKFKWEKVIPNEKIEYIPSPIPVEGQAFLFP